MEHAVEVNRGNEFLLHLKSFDIEKLDRLFLELLADKTFGASLLGRKIFKEEKNLFFLRLRKAVMRRFRIISFLLNQIQIQIHSSLRS